MPTLRTTDGINLYYTHSGHDNPIPLVFLHGYACTGRDWEPTAEALAARFQTWVLDFRGHDRSDDCPGECLLDHLVGDIKYLMEQFNLTSAVLIGHSMGGMAALQFVLQWPELVRGIVLAEAYPYLGSVVEVFGPAEDPDNDPYGYDSVFDRQTDSAIITRIRQQMSAGVERLPEGLFQSLLDFDAREQLHRIQVPAYLLMGARRWVEPDAVTGILVRLGYDRLPGLRWKLIDSHHFVMLEQPSSTLNAIRGFLD